MAEINTWMNPQVIWFLVGLILLLLEIIIPGFVIIFFGAGAWVTALFSLLFHPGINIQIIIFTVSSVVLLLIFRRYLRKQFFGGEKEGFDKLADEFLGKTAVVENDIRKGFPGKISFKGTTWPAISDETVPKGEVVEIIGRESINIIVKSIK